MLKFWPTTILFCFGIPAFFYFHHNYNLSYWYLIIWIKLFFIIQFFGAYLIRLNFHIKSVNSLSKQHKKVLLTFDDGPHNPNTLKVLEVLKKHDVKAVFFIIGKNIQANEFILKQIIEEGHQIGNHSFSHSNFFDVWTTKKVTSDIESCQKIIDQYQINSNLFRPPFGVTNPNIAKAVKNLNLISVGWNIRSYDTSTKSIKKINERILSRLKPGAIILLHDRLDFMPELLDELIVSIKAKGYGFANTLG